MSAAPDDGGIDTSVGSGIEIDDLEDRPGREIEEGRRYCPHGCGWWVPPDRDDLVDRHVCPVLEGVYDTPDDILDASDLDCESYLAYFIDFETGNLYRDALIADLKPRPPSERIRLLFDWELFDYQKAIVDDPNPDKSVNCSRQVGKTETGGAAVADKILFEAIFSDDDVMFAGDVLDTATEMFRRCKEHFERCPIPIEKLGVEDDNKLTWEFSNGSRILTGTLEGGGNTERGKLPKVIVVDEAALIQRNAFEQVVEPMFATHGDDHELIVMSTPRGKTGYHYDANQPGHRPDYFSVHSVPASANPLVDDSFLRRKKAGSDSITWRQEWRGEFVELGNAYLPTKLIRPLIPDERDPRDDHPKPETTYYLGVDVARKGKDRTVYCVMSGDGDVGYIENEDESRIPEILLEIERLHGRFNFAAVYVDENAVGGGLVDLEEYAGLEDVIEPYTTSTKGVAALYRRLKTDIEDEEITIPKHSRLIKETTALAYDYTANGLLQVSHPKENGHDDHPDALALANFARANEDDGSHDTDSYGFSFS